MISGNRSLEQMPHSKIPTDCMKVALLTRQVRTSALSSDYLHSGQFRQITGDFILHADGEIRVFAIRTQIFERQNRNRSFDLSGRLHSLMQPSPECERSEN